MAVVIGRYLSTSAKNSGNYLATGMFASVNYFVLSSCIGTCLFAVGYQRCLQEYIVEKRTIKVHL